MKKHGETHAFQIGRYRVFFFIEQKRETLLELVF